jgi:hypothetical protein
MSQVIQIVGALAILAAFAAAQLGVFDVRSWAYLWLNVIGALVLAIVAWHERQWGFLLLESVWTLVSAAGLIARAKSATSPSEGERPRPQSG